MRRLKRVWPCFVMLILAFTLMLGSFNVFAYAQGDTPEGKPFFAGTMVQKVKLNETFEVPAKADNDVEISVSAPNGQKFTETQISALNNEIKATQIGIYTVEYKSGEHNSYSYNVLCYEEHEYFLNIKPTRNDFIPSYRRAVKDSVRGRAEDSNLNIPAFELSYKNEKGDTVAVPGAHYKVEYDNTMADANPVLRDDYGTLPISTPINQGKHVIKNLGKNGAGVFNIKLMATVDPTTEKWYTQEYNINVQVNFESKTDPAISIVNINKSAYINSLVTLPVGTATDAYDNNVFVEVTVLEPAQPGETAQKVREYDVDDYGYATNIDNPGEEIKFDNKDVRTFYPTKFGTYKVTYVAVNGSQRESTPHVYNIEIDKDKLAPVIHELAEEEIPQKWGISKIFMGKGADEKRDDEARPAEFNLPLPVCVDNYSKQGDLQLTISLVNPNNRTVGRWIGSVSDFKSTAGVAIDTGYTEYYRPINGGTDDFESINTLRAESKLPPIENLNFKFDSDGFMKFSFNYIDFKNSKLGNRDSEKFGSWTLTYAVRDEANNGGSGTARRSYTIEVKADTFRDRIKPVIEDLDLPEYILISEEDDSFTVPSINATDDVATRLRMEYKLSTDAIKTDAQITIDDIVYTVVEEYNVKGAEVYPIRAYTKGQGENKITTHYLIISEDNKDFAMPLKDIGAQLRIQFWAEDTVGNKSEVIDQSIDFVYAELQAQDNFDFTGLIGNASGINLTTGEAKKVYNFGSFTVGNIEKRNYTGFELTVLNEENRSQYVSSYHYFRKHVVQAADPDDDEDKEVYSLTVRDIEFTPSMEGVYRLNIRVFDISGMSSAFGFWINVDPATTGGTKPVSAAISDAGQVRVSYELPKPTDYTTSDPDLVNEELLLCRRVEGWDFTLVGYDFMALRRGTYYVTDYIYVYDNVEFKNNLHHQKTMPFSATDKATPVIEIQGVMPTYSPVMGGVDDIDVYNPTQFITLPVITGYTSYERAVVDVKVAFDNTEDMGAKQLYKQYLRDINNNIILDNNGDPQFDLVFDTEHTIAADKTDPDAEDIVFENDPSGRWAFAADKEGRYTVSVNVKAPTSGQSIDKTYDITVGKRTIPVFEIINKTETGVVGGKFVVGTPSFLNDEWESVSIRLIDPNGSEVTDQASKKSYTRSTLKDFEAETEYLFEKSGDYQVEITATDSVGHKTTERYTINVASKGSTDGTRWIPLTIVLIVITILLILGIIVYAVRFRAVKKESK